MRKLFLFAAFCLFQYCNAQKPFELSTVIKQDSLSAQELYEATKSWFAESYVNSKAVIRDDNPGKQITGKGSIKYNPGFSHASIEGFIEYLIDIQFREGRLKLTTRNFDHQAGHRALFDNNMGILVDSLPTDFKSIGITGYNRKTMYKYYFKSAKPLCEATFLDIVESLKKFLAKRKFESKEDW